MVQGIEDLRTPLSTIIELDKRIRGTLSGFMMPSFVVDLPGGGGKRLVSTYEKYDPKTGVATYRAPGLDGVKGQMEYTYNDPKPVDLVQLAALNKQKAQALERGQTLEDFARGKLIDAEQKSEREFMRSPMPALNREVPTQVPMPAINWDAGRPNINKPASDISTAWPFAMEDNHRQNDAQLAARG
jgi:lysine 2,3-aminomutase